MKKLLSGIQAIRASVAEAFEAGREDRARMRRTVISMCLATYGTLSIIASSIFTGLLIAMPLADPNNGVWNRPENPVTVASTLQGFLAGVVCIALVRTSDKTRRLVAVIGIVTYMAYGIYDFIQP